MKKILFSLATIALMASTTVGATRAYFTDNVTVGNNTFTTGTVDIDQTWTSNLPINFSDLTPGKETVSKVIGVGYGGSIAADLFVGMKWQAGGEDSDFRNILEYYIEEVTSAGDHLRNVNGWTSIENIFTQWNQVADKVTNGDWKYYKLHVRVVGTAQDTLQGKTATDYLFIHAAQNGVGAPSTAPGAYEPK